MTTPPLLSLIMGSQSDWATLTFCADTLKTLAIPFETRIISAHRTPDLLFDYASQAQTAGIQVIIAAAGGAAHLPGMLASKTPLPVLGVPIPSTTLQGLDSLLSIVQMPAGIPVATLAIGKPGAINAALFAAAILAHHHPSISEALTKWRENQTRQVLDNPQPE